MAIIQISRITNRKGLTENLPQLAGAEFGWCTDSRRLFIGNGTLQAGAPVIGNTEILTEFSDITVLANYTYSDIVVGYAAQTGPTPSDPVVRSVQAKLDDFASVRDFGATGDGVTDDTAAINRAMFQLYCRENNTQTRRALYFPAGTYLVTDTIIIPTYAKLVGEGADCSIISLEPADSSLPAFVARYGDSLQQTGANIGVGGATAPRNIEISAMTFQSPQGSDVFLVEEARQCWFESVNFVGALTTTEVEDSMPMPDIAAVRFASTVSNVCQDVVLERCGFYRCAQGVRADQATRGITISNSGFGILNQGIVTSGAARGFRAVHNQFDLVAAEAIVYDAPLNVSGYNAFFNVGNSILNPTPTHPVIRFGSDNNVSVGDQFERSEAAGLIQAPVLITATVPAQGSSRNQLGRYAREIGRTYTLANDATDQLIFSINISQVPAFDVYYTITRGADRRTGTVRVTASPNDDSTTTDTFSDDYVETDDTGITLSVSQSGSTVSLIYSSTDLGTGAEMFASVCNLA